MRRGWQLLEDFAALRRLLEVRMGKAGKRESIQVLRLLESFPRHEVEVTKLGDTSPGGTFYTAHWWTFTPPPTHES